MVLVIFKFKQNIHGLGDVIRGLISVLQLKTELNFDLFVDMEPHAISKYLKYDLKMQYDDICQDFLNNSNNNKIIYKNIKKYIMKFSKMKQICIYTNCYPLFVLSKNIKDYMKNLLSFNDDFLEHFKTRLDMMPNDYTLYHFRLGDSYLIDDKKANNINVLINMMGKYKKKNSVLISDSLEFKKNISLKFNDVFVYLNRPIHCIKKDVDIDTFIDFCLIKNSKEIYSYSSYGNISGFVNWISNIYNIPLKKIN